MTKKRTGILVALLLVGLPSVAQANAGTPLMWAGILHLVFGNLLIGLCEGLLLAWVFRLPKLGSVGVLIMANYFSAWVAYNVIVSNIADGLAFRLDNAWALLWLLVAIAYALTLLLEWPFVAWMFFGKEAWLRKSILGSLLVQTASYTLIVWWYLSISGTSLYGRNEIVDFGSMSLPEDVVVYFISADDGDVYSMSLRDSEPRYVADLNSDDRGDRLLVREADADAGTWDLVGYVDEQVVVQEGLSSTAVPDRPRSTMDSEAPRYRSTWFNFGEVPKLGDAESSSWEFQTGFWEAEGLYGADTKSGRKVFFSFETPYVAWTVRNATHLPGDVVLLQLGADQICVYDPVEKQIALLARGYGPVAAIAEERPRVIYGDRGPEIPADPDIFGGGAVGYADIDPATGRVAHPLAPNDETRVYVDEPGTPDSQKRDASIDNDSPSPDA